MKVKPEGLSSLGLERQNSRKGKEKRSGGKREMDLLLWLIIAWNFFVSCWNAYASGLLWGISKGKGEKAIALVVLALALVGFYYTFILVGIALNILSTQFLLPINVIVGLPIILLGVVITINGWIEAIRTRSLRGILVSIYNTLALLWDINVWIRSFESIKDMGIIESLIESVEDSKDSSKAIIFLVIGLIITALVVVGFFYAGKKTAKKVMR
ncbi:MAG: hypothetical protein QXQ69_03390, partial [Candidatus Aenigmatarchaeota archaeon]